MGTRSLTFVYEKYGQVQKPVVNMYRQFDGYPTGHGAELAEFLTRGRARQARPRIIRPHERARRPRDNHTVPPAP